MNQIRVFTFPHAIGRKINLLAFLIDTKHFTYIPFSFGNLTNRLRCSTIVHIQMIPVVTLAHPNHALAILQVMTKATTIIHILIAGFLD